MDNNRFGDWDINSLETVSKEESDVIRKKAYERAKQLDQVEVKNSHYTVCTAISYNFNDELTYFDENPVFKNKPC